eukprot:TRINITY_DN29352_c0_g1_i1.p1 TRINITY_DN29352_c0_g1~~TRINITY_DN29352_c0_g1_i1.p1  ORF type:complete len:166 (-),score=30.17 TRINITY_DN29352_c0_g1_i1:28-525(-)
MLTRALLMRCPCFSSNMQAVTFERTLVRLHTCQAGRSLTDVAVFSTMSATGSRALPPGTADAQHQKMQESQQDKESENLDEILAGLDDDLASFASSTPLDLPLSATTSAYGGEGGGGVAEAAGAAAVRPTHNAAGPGGATASCAGGSGDGSDGDLDLDLELDLPM